MQVLVTRPVEIALRTLQSDDRQKVFSWIDHLRNWENDEGTRKLAKKVSPSDNVYILTTSSDVRIFFQLEKDRITILDLATKGTLSSFGHISG